MAALLLTPREHWWMYLAAVLPFHLFAQLLDFPLARVIIQYFANIGLAALGALAIGLGFAHAASLRPGAQCLHPGAVRRPARARAHQHADGDGVSRCSASPREMWLTVVARTVTNTFAVVTLVPLIVHCAERLRSGQRPISVKRAAEGVTLALATLAVCLLLFFIPLDKPERTPLLLYAPLPLVGWADRCDSVSPAPAPPA